jgi:hypothetical protein
MRELDLGWNKLTGNYDSMMMMMMMMMILMTQAW